MPHFLYFSPCGNYFPPPVFSLFDQQLYCYNLIISQCINVLVPSFHLKEVSLWLESYMGKILALNFFSISQRMRDFIPNENRDLVHCFTNTQLFPFFKKPLKIPPAARENGSHRWLSKASERESYMGMLHHNYECSVFAATMRATWRIFSVWKSPCHPYHKQNIFSIYFTFKVQFAVGIVCMIGRSSLEQKCIEVIPIKRLI